jgi:hypothetical protein
MTNATVAAPWQKNPYVWMIIVIPFSAVVFGIYMITVAVHSSDGLVMDDYYKKGKEINRVLVRDELAASLGLAATVRVNIAAGRVEVRLTGNMPVLHDEPMTLALYNATRAKNDISVQLSPAANGQYIANIGSLPVGNWNVELGTSKWRLTGRYSSGQTDLLRLKSSL